jgi:N-acetylglucosamine malate deacetylase 2
MAAPATFRLPEPQDSGRVGLMRPRGGANYSSPPSFVNVGPRQLRTFSYVDKESHLHLPELITRLVKLLEELKPAFVLSPAYEGGHPDHDTAALAVAAARRRYSLSVQHWEYRLYHADLAGAMITDDFLLYPSAAVEVYRLSSSQQARKSRMLASFRTQLQIIKKFSVYDERFREAPGYDFTLPPHDGKLLYECWGWDISGAEWRRRASGCFLRQYRVGFDQS